MTVQNLEKYTPISFYDVKDQLKEFIYARSDESFAYGNSLRDVIKSKADLQLRQQKVRELFLKAIGGLPASDTPLNARTTGVIRGDGYKIEKVIFESRPQAYVTANLYIPDSIMAPAAAVQFLCGHDTEAKHCHEFQTVCLYLVRAGFVVLAQDPVGQGERFSYYEPSIGTTAIAPGTREHTYAGMQCLPLGYSPAKYFIHDAMRGIDYLCSRVEVDQSRIGVTGNSGGGLQTCMMMMVDDRITAAAPGTFLSSRQKIRRSGVPQDAEQTWPGMLKYGFDHEDILLCMAPRPVMVLAVKYDFFPIEGTRETVERSRRYWQMYGKEDDIQMIEDDSVHQYTVVMAKAAAEFFRSVLTGNQAALPEESIRTVDPATLWCTVSGQTRGELPGARFIFDENLELLSQLEKKRSLIPAETRRQQAHQWLKDKIYYNRKPCELNVKHTTGWQLMDLTVQSSVWWSQHELLNHAFTFRSYKFASQSLPVTLAVWDGGTSQIQSHIEWIRKTCEAGRAVVVINTSGVGALLPDPLGGKGDLLEVFGTMYILSDQLLWLGDSMAALRTYDVLRAIDALKEWPNMLTEDLQLYAHGRQGLYAKFAAFVDERAKDIRVEDGMASFSEWIGSRYYNNFNIMSLIVPGMLQYFDLPDINLWLAEADES